MFAVFQFIVLLKVFNSNFKSVLCLYLKCEFRQKVIRMSFNNNNRDNSTPPPTFVMSAEDEATPTINFHLYEAARTADVHPYEGREMEAFGPIPMTVYDTYQSRGITYFHNFETSILVYGQSYEDRVTADDDPDEDLNASLSDSTISSESGTSQDLGKKVNNYPIYGNRILFTYLEYQFFESSQ